MASDLDASAPCLRCGRPAPPHGEHHHNPDEHGPVGKGSGGQGRRVAEHPRVVLCRTCHADVHMGVWVLHRSEDLAWGVENGIEIFERGIVLNDHHHDSRFWSDERLSSEWAEGEGKAQDGFEQQCNAAFEFYRRYRGQPEWYVRVAEILSDNSGLYVHPREVYRRIKLYVAFNKDWTVYKRFGKTLALAVAESDDPEKALEIANSRKDEGGRTQAEIVREIRHQAEPEPRKCPHCGGTL